MYIKKLPYILQLLRFWPILLKSKGDASPHPPPCDVLVPVCWFSQIHTQVLQWRSCRPLSCIVAACLLVHYGQSN